MERMQPSPGDCHARAPIARARNANLTSLFASVAVVCAVLKPLPAFAQKARISNLSDVNFGLIVNPQAESRRSQNICVYSNSAGSTYSVIASGSGPGASFALASGASSLSYDVEWSPQSGQVTGTQLSASVALSGQTSAASHQFCNSGPAASASLTVVIRAADLAQAQEGNYSGSLTLLITAE